jgi:predicted Zn-dependent protease
MPGFFYNLGYNLGQRLAPKLHEANWVWRSLTGTEEEAIRAEFAVGRDLAWSLDRQLEACADPAVNDLVTGLGARLAGCVKNPHWRFRFRVVQMPEVNAFALPGGFVFVTQSLVEFCERNPHELAFILGHEMGHVTHRHAIHRLMANAAFRTAIAGLAPARGLAPQALTGLASTLLRQSYSQDQELEADSGGVQFARAAGFDPRAALGLLDRLGALSGDLPAWAGYLFSHPSASLRIQNLQRLLHE